MTEKACGFAAVIGPPNAGKSTLSNALVGQKVSIVTQKAQTTRMRLRAVVMHDAAQIILVDTPGIFAPKQRLDRAMVNEAWQGVEDADMILLVLDAARPLDDESEAILDNLENVKKPVALILNKVDTLAKEDLLARVHELNLRANFTDTFLVSALTGDGLDVLKQSLAQHMPPGPWLYPEDQAADVPSALLAAEITREKMFLRLHQELPYALTVETDKWKRGKDGSIRIEQTVFVSRDGQKAIVLGKGGQTMRRIGTAARKELEMALDRRIHLFAHVKYRKDWMNDSARYSIWDLDYNA